MKTYPEFPENDLSPTETEMVAEDSLADDGDLLGKDQHLALWVNEARRRLEEMRSGAVKGVPVEEAFASIRRELGLR